MPESPARNRLIYACAASAHAAIDAAARAVDLPQTDAGISVEIFPGTRGGRTVTAEERDRLARTTIAELRARLARLTGLFPTGSNAIVLPFDEDDLQDPPT